MEGFMQGARNLEKDDLCCYGSAAQTLVNLTLDLTRSVAEGAQLKSHTGHRH